ncbi:hypothetical protein DSECCO2_656390 [anaerobic digester metagenome]
MIRCVIPDIGQIRKKHQCPVKLRDSRLITFLMEVNEAFVEKSSSMIVGIQTLIDDLIGIEQRFVKAVLLHQLCQADDPRRRDFILIHVSKTPYLVKILIINPSGSLEHLIPDLGSRRVCKSYTVFFKS